MSLVALVSSPEGIRSATNNRISVPFQRAANAMLTASASPTEKANFAIEASKLMKNMCDTRVGSSHFARCGGQQILLRFLDVLKDPSVPDTAAKKEGSFQILVLSYKHSKTFCFRY